MSEQPIIAIAGANGDLGARIASALVARGAHVRALVRHGLGEIETAKLKALEVTLKVADPTNLIEMTAACKGAGCVGSALNGLDDVILGRQGLLLDAAIIAGVPRFVSSDYSADFTKTRPGDNRNLDWRRQFMARAELAPIKVMSILNGTFMDMLGNEMPIVQANIKRVLYWNNANQLLDFTTKDNVAAYTAAAALDITAPRILRIAGDQVSAKQLAADMTTVTGERYKTLWVGSIGMLSIMISLAKKMIPPSDNPFPPWQGMQYMRDQFSGRAKLSPLDNDRYEGIVWISVTEMFAARQ
jgi:NAD(P)-dependent dehydrogenase (short-subunit alcohol dehydrogenase family)